MLQMVGERVTDQRGRGLQLQFRQQSHAVGELLKEAVPKLVRVAVLYDPVNPPNVLEVKEVLPVAARAGVDYSTLGGTRCGRFREGIRCAE